MQSCCTGSSIALTRTWHCAGEYISESVWASRADFDNWRNSQSFGAAHGSSEGKAVGPAASKTGDMMRGPPVAKFYEAVTVTEQTLF